MITIIELPGSMIAHVYQVDEQLVDGLISSIYLMFFGILLQEWYHSQLSACYITSIMQGDPSWICKSRQ
jgi:hypothetical protein